MSDDPEKVFEVVRVNPYPNGDVDVTFQRPDSANGRILRIKVYMVAKEYELFSKGVLAVTVSALLKMPQIASYQRKDFLVSAEQVDLEDLAQRSRLGISAYQRPTGGAGGCIVSNGISIRVDTGDWIITSRDGSRRVMSDTEFKEAYEVASDPTPEVPRTFPGGCGRASVEIGPAEEEVIF